ncbi:MAG: cation:proton antiporter [Bacteroidia bacterium]
MTEILQELAEHPFYELAIILLLAALLGGIGQWLRQPLIVTFIALGVLVGPSVLNLVQSQENIQLLAETGIAILLFIVGLKLDLRLIKTTGKVALLTGLGQVFFTSAIGYFIGLAMGFSTLHSFYIAVALTFSSTIIIVKLLSDKKEIDALHGQIAIGFLIVQDLVVILVMIILSTISNGQDTSLLYDIGQTLLSMGILLGGTLLMMRFIIPALSFFLARSQELLALFGIAWAVGMAALAELIGFSPEVGAFLAGISLASSPFRESIAGRLISLRDFLLLFFFVNLGANLNLTVIGEQVVPAIWFSLFVLIGNPLIVLIIMGWMGYRKRTGFLAGLTVAQISEFSLIFAGLGLQVGHLNESVVGLITLVGLITIGLSTYLILYSQAIYDRIAPFLSVFERKDPYRESRILMSGKQPYDVIIFGLGRLGGGIARKLDEHDEVDYMGVDFDPQVVKNWQGRGKSVVYGDLEDQELLEHLPLEAARYVISTIPDPEHSRHLIKNLRARGYEGKIFLTALLDKDYESLNQCGADEVLLPHQMAAENFYNSYLKQWANKQDLAT